MLLLFLFIQLTRTALAECSNGVCQDERAAVDLREQGCFFDEFKSRCEDDRGSECYNKGVFGECGYLVGFGAYDEPTYEQYAKDYNYPEPEEIAAFLEFAAVKREENPKDAPFVNLRGIKLDHAVMPNLRLDYVDMRDGSAIEANFMYSEFKGSKLQRLNAPGAVFMRSNLFQASLFKAKLQEANFAYAIVSETSFFQADITRAEFVGGFGFRTSFYQAKALEANFREATLLGAVFHKADLSYAWLEDADLRNYGGDKTVFTRATINRAKFRYAYLCGAVFDPGTIQTDSIWGAQYDSQTTWDIGTAGLLTSKEYDIWQKYGAVKVKDGVCNTFKIKYTSAGAIAADEPEIKTMYGTTEFDKLVQRYPGRFVNISKPGNKDVYLFVADNTSGFNRDGGDDPRPFPRTVFRRVVEHTWRQIGSGYSTSRPAMSGYWECHVYMQAVAQVGTETNAHAIAGAYFYDEQELARINAVLMGLEGAVAIVPFAATTDSLINEGMTWNTAASLAFDLADVATLGATKTLTVSGRVFKASTKMALVMNRTALTLRVTGIALMGKDAIGTLLAGDPYGAGAKGVAVALQSLGLRPKLLKVLSRWAKPKVSKVALRFKGLFPRNGVNLAKNAVAACAVSTLSDASPLKVRNLAQTKQAFWSPYALFRTIDWLIGSERAFAPPAIDPKLAGRMCKWKNYRRIVDTLENEFGFIVRSSEVGRRALIANAEQVVRPILSKITRVVRDKVRGGQLTEIPGSILVRVDDTGQKIITISGAKFPERVKKLEDFLRSELSDPGIRFENWIAQNASGAFVHDPKFLKFLEQMPRFQVLDDLIRQANVKRLADGLPPYSRNIGDIVTDTNGPVVRVEKLLKEIGDDLDRTNIPAGLELSENLKNICGESRSLFGMVGSNGKIQLQKSKLIIPLWTGDKGNNYALDTMGELFMEPCQRCVLDWLYMLKNADNLTF